MWRGSEPVLRSGFGDRCYSGRHLAETQEAQLNDLAARTGRGTDEPVQRAVARMIEYDAKFPEAVERGRDAARRGDLLDHDEVVEKIERMLTS